MYANLCKQLSAHWAEMKDKEGNVLNFKRSLISRCQAEFTATADEEISLSEGKPPSLVPLSISVWNMNAALSHTLYTFPLVIGVSECRVLI